MNVFEVFAKLSLDTKDYDDKLKSAGDRLKDGLGNAASAVGTATVAAVTASATAIGAIVKNSVDEFANYEQLIGGSKLVFGEAYDFIKDKAEHAYETVQLSQNDYLEQVNGFAVGLKEALGGNEEAAAQLADKIVTAEADVVAAMGITQEAAQNAFNGIMKGNYTMVDNLMLGIKPTKEGIQEMIDKVNDWNAAQGEATQYTMDNVADIQSALVDYIEMQGLAGYASKEASDTITGSLSKVKASWSNLLLSISGGGVDIEQSIDNLVTSVTEFAGNIVPVIEEALNGIGKLVSGLAPVIADALPELTENLLPKLIDAAVNLTNALIDAFPEVISSLMRVIPDIVSQLMDVVANLLEMLMTSGLPMLLELAVEVVLAIGQGLAKNLPELMPALIEMITYMIEIISKNLPEFVKIALQIILAIVEGLVNNLDQLMFAVSELIIGLIGGFIAHLPEFLEIGVKIVLEVVKGIVMAIPNLVKAIGKLFGIVKDTNNDIKSSFDDTFSGIDQSIRDTEHSLDKPVRNIRQSVKDIREETDDTTYAVGKATLEWEKTIKDSSDNIVGIIRKMSDGSSEVIKDGNKTILDQSGNVVETVKASAEDMKSMSNTASVNVQESMRDISSATSEAARSVERDVDVIVHSLNSVSSGSVSVGARASGGFVKAGQPYIVGELGPELVVPQSSGYVHNAKDTENIMNRGFGGNIVININGDIYDDEQSLQRKLRSATLDILREQVAYG